MVTYNISVGDLIMFYFCVLILFLWLSIVKRKKNRKKKIEIESSNIVFPFVVLSAMMKKILLYRLPQVCQLK